MHSKITVVSAGLPGPWVFAGSSFTFAQGQTTRQTPSKHKSKLEMTQKVIQNQIRSRSADTSITGTKNYRSELDLQLTPPHEQNRQNQRFSLTRSFPSSSPPLSSQPALSSYSESFMIFADKVMKEPLSLLFSFCCRRRRRRKERKNYLE